MSQRKDYRALSLFRVSSIVLMLREYVSAFELEELFKDPDLRPLFEFENELFDFPYQIASTIPFHKQTDQQRKEAKIVLDKKEFSLDTYRRLSTVPYHLQTPEDKKSGKRARAAALFQPYAIVDFIAETKTSDNVFSDDHTEKLLFWYALGGVILDRGVTKLCEHDWMAAGFSKDHKQYLQMLSTPRGGELAQSLLVNAIKEKKKEWVEKIFLHNPERLTYRYLYEGFSLIGFDVLTRISDVSRDELSDFLISFLEMSYKPCTVEFYSQAIKWIKKMNLAGLNNILHWVFDRIEKKDKGELLSGLDYDSDMVQSLLGRNDRDDIFYSSDRKGNLIFHRAAAKDNCLVLMRLSKHYPVHTILNKSYQLPIYFAYLRGSKSTETVLLFLMHGDKKFSLQKIKDPRGFSQTVLAVLNDDFHVADQFSKQDLSVDLKDEKGTTQLERCFEEKDPYFVEVAFKLIQHGAKYEGFHPRFVKYVLEKGLEIQSVEKKSADPSKKEFEPILAFLRNKSKEAKKENEFFEVLKDFFSKIAITGFNLRFLFLLRENIIFPGMFELVLQSLKNSLIRIDPSSEPIKNDVDLFARYDMLLNQYRQFISDVDHIIEFQRISAVSRLFCCSGLNARQKKIASEVKNESLVETLKSKKIEAIETMVNFLRPFYLALQENRPKVSHQVQENQSDGIEMPLLEKKDRKSRR